MNLSSLYIHIPFCRKKCRYCDFYSVPYDMQLADDYLAALSKEIVLVKKNFGLNSAAQLQTVFIGGGTPTVLSAAQLAALCGLICKAFPLAPGHEWTVECNPESFTQEKAAALLEGSVTRLTFGFQSLDNRELSFLGRAHDAQGCRRILADSALEKFRSICVDLMYGLPGQTMASLERSLGEVFRSPRVNHISAYELAVADGTSFGRHRSLLPLPGETAMSAMSRRLRDFLEEHGFRQYEVSNFAKKGHESRHNMACWGHEPYLGLGCAAHSYLPPRRMANVRDVNRYVLEINGGGLPRDFTETVDADKLGLELLFLGLRTVRGINEEEFKIKTLKSFSDFTDKEKIAECVSRGLLCYEKPFWKPTRKGLLMADGIAREIIP
jgi:putative oxygen-independent coproporphyrinogen III oxidase